MWDCRRKKSLKSWEWMRRPSATGSPTEPARGHPSSSGSQPYLDTAPMPLNLGLLASALSSSTRPWASPRRSWHIAWVSTRARKEGGEDDVHTRPSKPKDQRWKWQKGNRAGFLAARSLRTSRDASTANGKGRDAMVGDVHGAALALAVSRRLAVDLRPSSCLSVRPWPDSLIYIENYFSLYIPYFFAASITARQVFLGVS